MSSSLITITNDLGSFNRSNWIVTTYLITYTGQYVSESCIMAFCLFSLGFILIWAKFSDVFNQRLVQCFALFFFIVFSAACGAAQTMTQL